MMNRRIRWGLGCAFGLAATAVLSGCSQFAQLQPVAGDAITAVNNATSDVVFAQGISVMEWPKCEFENKVYVCTGTTVDGQEIKGVAPDAEALSLTVTVGGKTLYQGPVIDVINEAGRTK